MKNFTMILHAQILLLDIEPFYYTLLGKVFKKIIDFRGAIYRCFAVL